MNCEIFRKITVDRRAIQIAVCSHDQLCRGKDPVSQALDATSRTDKPTNGSRPESSD